MSTNTQFPIPFGADGYNLREKVAIAIAENLTSEPYIMMCGTSPYIASPEFYKMYDQNYANSTDRSIMFSMETAAQSSNYTKLDYKDIEKGDIPLPTKTISTGEYSESVNVRAFNAEEIQRYNGNEGRIRNIINDKMKAPVADMYRKFDRYIETKFIENNLIYACKTDKDANDVKYSVPFTVGADNMLSYSGANGLKVSKGMPTSFETFNILSGEIEDFIGYSSDNTKNLHIMSNTLHRTLYAGSGRNLSRYVKDYSKTITQNVFSDETSGMTISCGNKKTMKHIAGTAMPILDYATNTLDNDPAFTIDDITFKYDPKLRSLIAGTITIKGTGVDGKTLKSGDVLFIDGSGLIKTVSDFEEPSDFRMPIVIGHVQEYVDGKNIYNYRDLDGSTATEGKFVGGKITVPFVGYFRPKLDTTLPVNAGKNPFYNPNFVIDTSNLDATTIDYTNIMTTTIAALKTKTLIPLIGDREHVLIYNPKNIILFPRIVTLPNAVFDDTLARTTANSVTSYGEYLNNSALPITYGINNLLWADVDKGTSMSFQLYSENGVEFSNYLASTGAICVRNVGTSSNLYVS